MLNLFKKKKPQQNETPQQMECPKCGGIMTLTNGLTYTFHCRGQEVEVSNVTAMKCANCGEMMFSWDEAQRIQKFVHKSVGWEDKTE
nr:MAG TPA: MqsA [Bacteriophage sp.]